MDIHCNSIRTYVWGSGLSGSMQDAGSVGGLLEVCCYGSATTNCFPAFDGHGNVAALINAADGTVAANYEYAAFGEPVRVSGIMARNNPFRFSTKYADDESDLLYYGYRYYKPSTGTWPNRDPIFEDGFQLKTTGENHQLDPILTDVEFLIQQKLMIELKLDKNPYVMLANAVVGDVDFNGLCSAFKRCKNGGAWAKKANGVIPDADGCSVPWFIPISKNQPAPPADFKQPCDDHDYCYSDCATPKSQCDKNLYNGLLNTCAQTADHQGLTGQVRYDFMVRCNSWSAQYYYAVKFFGCGPYKNRQKLNCSCCGQ